MTLDCDQEVYYAFTPSESGYYTASQNYYAMDGCTMMHPMEFCSESYGSLSGTSTYTDSQAFVHTMLNAGQTYYLHVYNYDASMFTTSISVSKTVAPTRVYTEQESYTMSLAEGFSNTRTISVRYEPVNAYADVVWTSSNPDIVSVYSQTASNVTVTAQAEGSAAIRATVNGVETDNSFTFTVTAPITLQLDTPAELQLDNYEGKSVYFTPTQTDSYCFAISGIYSEEMMSFFYPSFHITNTYGDGMGYSSYGGDSNMLYIPVYLYAGITYQVTLNNPYNVSMPSAVTVSYAPDPESISISGSRNIFWDGDTVTYQHFNCLCTPQYADLRVTWTSSNTDVLTIDESYDEYCSAMVTGTGETTLTATASNGLSASITVTVTKPTAIVENETIQLNFTPDNCETRCTFTPATSGSYTFRSTHQETEWGDRYALGMSIYSDAGYASVTSTDDDGYCYALATLEAGVEYTLEIYDNSCMDATYFLNVEKSPAPEGIALSSSNRVFYGDYAIGNTYSDSFRFSPGGATDTVTVTSDNESVVKIIDVNTLYFTYQITGYGTASITATTANGHSASMTVTVKEIPTIQAGYTEELSMTAGSSKCYYFTPEKTGYYTLNSTVYHLNKWESTSPVPSVSAQDAEVSCYCMSYQDIDYNFMYLEAGTTYTLYLYNYNGSDITSTITLEEATVPTDISIYTDGTDKTMTLYYQPDDSNWFNISYGFAPQTAMAVVTATSSDESVVTITGVGAWNLSCRAVGIGTATITLKVNDEVYDTCTVNIIPIPDLTEISMNSVNNLAGRTDDIWVNATPSGAVLNCEFSIADTSVAQIIGTYGTGCTIEYLAPGTTTLTATDIATGISTTCTITTSQPKTITEGYSEVLTLERGSRVYYTFTPETTAAYQLISSNYSNDNLGFSIYSSDNSWIDYSNSYENNTYNVYTHLEAGKTYRIEVYDYGNYDSTTSTITLKKATVLESISFYESDRTIYYNPDSAESYYLGLALNPSDGYSKITFTSSDDSVASIDYYGRDYCVVRIEGIGQTTITATTFEGVTAACTVTVAERPLATSLTCHCDRSVTAVGMSSYFYVYSEPEGSSPKCTFTVSDPTMAEITEANSNYIRFTALKTGTFTITATDTLSGLSISYTVTVEEPDSISTGSRTELALDYNDWVYYSYTPTESGQYYISTEALEGTSGLDANYYSVDVFTNGNYISTNITAQDDVNYIFMDLEAGNKYTFCVTNYWGDNGTSSITFDKASAITGISAEKDIVTRYVHGPNNYNSGSTEIRFTPATSFTNSMTWVSSNPEVADIEYFSGSTCGYCVNGVGTAVLTGTTPDGLSVSFTVQVLQPNPIALDEEKSVTLDRTDEMVYTFTPDVSGRYVFTAKAVSGKTPSTWLTYTGQSFNEIYTNGLDYDQVFADLIAGNTYYIVTENYSSTTCDCTISVTRAAEEITGFKLVQGEAQTMEMDDRYLPIYAVFEPFNACEEIIEWTSSDPKVLNPMGGGYTAVDFFITGDGTTTISATSKSGMQASITVTIKDGLPVTCSHIWGDWTETVAPTILLEGKEVRTCTLCDTTETRTVAALSNPFIDVEERRFFYDAVLWAADRDITKGHGNANTFCPDQECTRAEIVTFLWRAAGEPAPETTLNPFTDVNENSYYYKAVLWAVENGITNGYGEGDIFNPDGTCTRGQVATFLHRYRQTPEPSTALNPFTDVGEGKYYYTAVLWAVEEGITNGYGEGDIFNPDGICTRGQIVTFLYRAMN